jgi:hypothetical protein
VHYRGSITLHSGWDLLLNNTLNEALQFPEHYDEVPATIAAIAADFIYGWL